MVIDPKKQISILEIDISAEELIRKAVNIEGVSILDSCGAGHLGSHLLIIGMAPILREEINDPDPDIILRRFDEILSIPFTASIFTISYGLGLKLEGIKSRFACKEPDISIAAFDTLIFHDYNSGKTWAAGNAAKFREIEDALANAGITPDKEANDFSLIKSDFKREDYIEAINQIKALISEGDTYQSNLTQQVSAQLPEGIAPENIFLKLRADHPAPFGAFLRREKDTVISASPERFLQIKNGIISSSPIKGTRKRSPDPIQDEKLKKELLSSEKDIAENTMIVDLLRNDLGRICEYASVKVEKLCDIESHPSLYHLVSTISGRLKKGISFGAIIKAVFPCGSITGCPKIRTMEIIDKIERSPRGLSMGAIGYVSFEKELDLNVAIRTATVKDKEAVFKVGGGIVIDSDPQAEYEESLIKAKALLNAMNANADELF